MNKSSTNSTWTVFPFEITWSMFAVIRLIIAVIAFFLNTQVLTFYVIRPNICIRSPFSGYLIALLISNILETILYFPFTIIANLGTLNNRFFPGDTGCIASIYGTTLIRSLCLCSHALITINRVWAMTFPISYKDHHGPWFTWGLCAGVVLCVHALGIPAILTRKSSLRQNFDWAHNR
ncbi:uncharacterized protein LOC129595538 [Paramacrobiotus metropolitanus]|uniref:uncharacterized protein LOC129595538 n=1 Tax=Paramacrobiotus metropolitanus TaxID=2943436 RepID=UPI00244573A9|nr:uncharacterized protein LOC129595538 [Paramacrobiotus metropolitanus]